jgi:hypothetical protein
MLKRSRRHGQHKILCASNIPSGSTLMERALSALPMKRVLLNSSFCSVLFKDKGALNTLQGGSVVVASATVLPGMLNVLPDTASSRSDAALRRCRRGNDSWMFENACCTFLQAPVSRAGTSPPQAAGARIRLGREQRAMCDVPRELGPR